MSNDPLTPPLNAESPDSHSTPNEGLNTQKSDLRSSATEEYLDIVDAKGHPTGQTKLRKLVHRDGDLHRAVDIWVINQRRQVLLQHRAPEKDSYPNYWDISCGGHVVAGETPLMAAVSELHEELGLIVQPDDLTFLTEWHTKTRPAPDFLNNSINILYLIQTNCEISDFILQASEVSEVKYLSADELEQIVQENQAYRDNPSLSQPATLLVGHPHAYQTIIKILREMT